MCTTCKPYSDVVLAGVVVLVRVACLGVIIIAFTLIEPCPQDVDETMVKANALVLHCIGHSTPISLEVLTVVRVVVIVALTGTLSSNCSQRVIPVLYVQQNEQNI